MNEEQFGRDISPAVTLFAGLLFRNPNIQSKGLGSNPFKGKTFEEIDKILMNRGFIKTGSNPEIGKGSYFHPTSDRKYYLDKGGKTYREGKELPHVDVHRRSDGVNLESKKRRYPTGDKLIEPKP